MIGLRGTISGLSSAPDSRADVKLAGNVDTYAPVNIDGRINLLSAALYTDIALKFSNMELTTFNPYSGKYAGYDISKGKLTTELHYKIDNRKLDLQHHIVLDQLEFGTPTNSKDAVPLPVRLAVALLKDRNGVIARARADAVQSAILGGSSVMPAQIFLTERASNKASNNSARMELTLQ
jgi:hypothetical protein